MNRFFSKQTISILILSLVSLAGVFLSARSIEKTRPPLPPGFEDEDIVFKGSEFKDFSLGLNGLLADWYWIQSLQYLGGKFAKKPNEKINVDDLRSFDPKLLYPLLDNATSFDPEYIEVYEYGAIVLPAIDPELAIRIVEKGIARNPGKWRLYHHLGYIYWRMGNFEKAAEAYSRGASIEGATPIMATMAARMLSDGGSRQTARDIYRQMIESSGDSQTVEYARLQLKKLSALDQIEAINQILMENQKNTGSCIKDLSQLLPELSSVELPDQGDFQVDRQKNLVDPTGAPFLLNQNDCTVGLDREKTGLPFN